MDETTTLKAGEIVVASKHYKMHWITPGNEYEVMGRDGMQILVCNDYGNNVWKHARFFDKKAKVKKAPRKMTFETPSIGEWVIGSLHATKGFSMTTEPKPHKDEASAKAECERLAALYSDKKFVYMQIKGACRVQGAVWE